MTDLKTIAESMYTICFTADREITGLPEKDARVWARVNSLRHAYTVKTIIEHVKRINLHHPAILNASGIGCGHQDFSIVYFLKEKAGIPVDWTVIESPENSFLNHTYFKNYLHDLGITLTLTDLSQPGEFNTGNTRYDIIIFTEIAEHLDHSVLLRTLARLRTKLKENGLLILTTPNLVSLRNRIKTIAGNGDHSFFGDGTENLTHGLYGHIVLYDIKRLKRLLEDTGFNVRSAKTIACGYGPETLSVLKIVFYRIIDFVSLFIKNSRPLIFLTAVKREPRKIPFEI